MRRDLTGARLLDRYWTFGRDNGDISSNFFQFLSDGTIGNYDHPNERKWLIEDGIVCLLDEGGNTTCRLTGIEETNAMLTLSGKHLPDPKITLCLIEQPERPRIKGTKHFLQEDINRYGWSIGEHTYGLPMIYEPGLTPLSIGKYTSIAAGVIIALGNHRSDTVSSYPFMSLATHWPGTANLSLSDHSSRGGVAIGSDVWIGVDVFIGSGVTIGHGAVVGAKSVVTKDVPPYSVCVGNPARVVRERFAPDVVAALLELSWWDWPDQAVDRYLHLILSPDVVRFLAVAQAKGASGP